MASIRPKFCSNCGYALKNLNDDNDKEIKKCPKCGIDLLQVGRGVIPLRNTSVVDQLPYKSPGTAALIAFIGGIFALLGLGHIFVGKIGKGFGILVSGIIIYVLFVIMAISLPGMLLLGLVESSTGDAGSGGII